jgi:hypothetical protein
MVKKTTRKSVDKSAARNYRIVAESFYNGAEVAKEYEYWNAAGVLLVHSAIAYSDAICIKYGGTKSQSEDHHQVVSLVKEMVAESKEKKSALNHLERIIEHKTAVSYSGDIYEKKDIDLLWKYIDRFKSWAEKLLSE